MDKKVERKLLNLSNKGIIAASVVMVIGAAITIFIGIWILSLVMTSIDQSSFSTAANTTYAQVQSITWNSIQLLAIGLIVMAFAVIMTFFAVRGKE